jgi:hypothetical protein
MVVTGEKQGNRTETYPSITSFPKISTAVGLQRGCHSQRLATERRKNSKNISFSFAI